MALWRWYMQMNQVEDAFRISMSNLQLRPEFHQKTERVDAHSLVCFLSLVPRRTMENWMKCRGPNRRPRHWVGEVAAVRRVDVVLPTRAHGAVAPTEVRLRVVIRPDERGAELLNRPGQELPTASQQTGNAAVKNDSMFA